LQQEMEAEIAKSQVAGVKTILLSDGDAEAEAATDREARAAPGEETIAATSEATQMGSDSKAGPDGFQVAQSKSAKTRAAGQKKKKGAAAKAREPSTRHQPTEMGLKTAPRLRRPSPVPCAHEET
jgi:hypothetical protein